MTDQAIERFRLLLGRHVETVGLILGHLELGTNPGFEPDDILVVANREAVSYNVALLRQAVDLGIESLGSPNPEVRAMEKLIGRSS